LKGGCEMIIRIKLFIFCLLIGSYFELGNAQTYQARADTTKTLAKIDSMRLTQDILNEQGEIELSEINIEAVIEKPRVAILPKRVEPELGAMEFVDRSFEQELKKAPDNLMIQDSRLFVPKKIENLKQKLLERNEKLEKNK
jgi:hypothetical protein